MFRERLSSPVFCVPFFFVLKPSALNATTMKPVKIECEIFFILDTAPFKK